jgi:hypothetical protein
MYPAISHELQKARAADLYRRAERYTLVQAARQACHAQTRQGSPPVPRPPSANRARRVLTLLAARGLPWPTSAPSQPLRTYPPAGRQ